MSRNSIGTVTDRDRLVPLHREDDGFFVDVSEPVEGADVPDEGAVAWRYLEERDVPRLAFAPVGGEDEAGTLPTREVTGGDESKTIGVPDPLLIDGLGIVPDEYDDENPLLFEADETDGLAVGTNPEGEPAGTAERAVVFEPLRFADGTPYGDEPLSQSSMDSDPVAEETLAHEGSDEAAPQPGTVSAPIDGDVVDEVLLESDADRAAVERALEEMARGDVVTERNDHSEGQPVVADDRAVIALAEDDWGELVAPELDADDEIVEAVREIHARQAELLLQRAETDTAGVEGHPLAVIQPDRRYETDAQPD